MKINEIGYLGLSAACVERVRGRDNDHLPKFLLFSDIDTHDLEVLRTVCQHFARNGLSFFVLGTNKGYHVISPDLLSLGEWNEKKSMINKLVTNYYRFEVIRISNKKNDNYIGFYDQWYDKKHPVSMDLIDLMRKRFNKKDLFPSLNCNDNEAPADFMRKTRLQFIGYTHHEIDF